MPRISAPVLALGAPLFVSGCAVIETVLEGLGVLAEQPRFAYAIEFDADPNPAINDVVTELRTATIVGDTMDEALNINSVQLLESASLVDVLSLRWAPDNEHIAAELYEFIFGGEFDIWVQIFDRNLQSSFSASDDVLAGQADGICPTDENIPALAADFLAFEIEIGAQPVGTTVEVLWGTGTVIAADFIGWVGSDQFYVTLNHEPEIQFVPPGGAAPQVVGLLGDDVDLGLLYEKDGAGWTLIACGFDTPVITPPGTQLRDVAIASGALTLDGAPLLSTTGVPLAGNAVVKSVDGPY